ncbi:MAG: AraC family transcriptional regulator [Tunicatimonas sp.]
MVCPRCIEAVSQVLERLDLQFTTIELGEVTLEAALTHKQKEQLATMLEARGFELLEDKRSRQISQIKSIIIKQIHHRETPLEVNFSTLISNNLHQEYSSLSKLFSSVEGITIEKFILKQKVEKIKELLFYDEMALSQIAYQLGYSSVAHLSAQFKKETGMSPSHFRKLKSRRKPLDSI